MRQFTMPRNDAERELTQLFAATYRHAQSPVVLEIEHALCGCDYGGTSWTTEAEARRMVDLLGLGPGVRYLDVGAGSGWPGLYLARLSGCNAVLLDVPLPGLRIAAERAVRERLDGRCAVAVADGAALPLQDGFVDAVGHFDVLCCLAEKQAVLGACRRVVKPHGLMAFTVISIAPGLSSADYDAVLRLGPPFVEAPASYPEMLRQTGWELTDQFDMTDPYVAATRHLVRLEEARMDALRDLLGEDALEERIARHRRAAVAAEAGWLCREIFVARPAS